MRVFRLFLALCAAVLAIAADSDNYHDASAAAAKKGVLLQAGSHYASKAAAEKTIVDRLLAPYLARPATWNSMQTCLSWLTNVPEQYWDCNRPRNFKFKGEVLEYTQVEINAKRRQQINLDHNECYSIITHNCQTYVRELFKSIKARQVLNEASRLVGRNLDLVARALYEGSSDTLVAREEPLALDMEKRTHERDSLSAAEVY